MEKNNTTLDTFLLFLSSSMFILSSIGLFLLINHLYYINSSFTISYTYYSVSELLTILGICLFSALSLFSLILFMVIDWIIPGKEDESDLE